MPEPQWRRMEPQPDHFHRDIIGKPKPWKQEDWERLLPQDGDKEIKPPADMPTARPVWAGGEWGWRVEKETK